ncbi:NAD-dependent epimerase/dehydratase family protein [Flavobacterium sp. W22_SRS_FP1]|uniref:NAD-dependent epimerase/dehydratase family protein n=1 Tax=Flavobacterium sp. W22_SRS_FP1 TaxID=3240276 RepID=UPI003F92E0D4
MKQISILGCGWLGLPLAKALVQNGFSIHGSTTSTEKLTTLKKLKIQPFLIALESNKVVGAIEDFLQESKILIIDIPPKLRGNHKEDFIGKIQLLVPYIEKSNIKNVLFISSTSVYGDRNDKVTEETDLNPDSESGKQLAIVEKLLQTNTSFKTTVLRFGGLIGEDRHPVCFLAGRKNLENPEAPINLIHQDDCISIILKILETKTWGDTFNAATPFHPSRSVYYTQKAIELNLAPPTFNYDNPSVGKTILSDKLKRVLSYTFTKKDL